MKSNPIFFCQNYTPTCLFWIDAQYNSGFQIGYAFLNASMLELK